MKPSVRKRILQNIEKFRSSIRHAIETRASEAETVAHVRLFLYEAMGYDFVREISSEEKIQGHYCDLAIKLDEHKQKTNERIQYLIEVKPAKTKLDHNHIFQAKAYGINSHIDWIVLTNGACWKLYKLNRNPEEGEPDDILISEFDILSPSFDFAKHEPLFDALSREGLIDGARERLYEMAMDAIGIGKALSPEALANAIMSEDVIRVIRRELRRTTNTLLPVELVESAIISSVIIPELCSDKQIKPVADETVKCEPSSHTKRNSYKFGIYRIEARGVSADVILNTDGATVQSGTRVSADTVSSFYGSDRKKRDELIGNGTISDGIFTSDVTFKSLSQAGGVIIGRCANARTEFKFVRALEDDGCHN